MLKQAHKQWVIHRNLWKRNELPKKPRLLMFRAIVVETLFSAIETLVLSNVQERRLQNVVSAYGRKLMGRTAVKTQDERFRKADNARVFQYLGMLSMHTELVLRRLRWYQRIFARPDLFQHTIVALFGKFNFETVDTIDGDGVLCAHSNPWAQQLWSDLQMFDRIDTGQEFLEVLEGKIGNLLHSQEIAEQFVSLDIDLLRASFVSVAIPPPGYQPPMPEPDAAPHSSS